MQNTICRGDFKWWCQPYIFGEQSFGLVRTEPQNPSSVVHYQTHSFECQTWNPNIEGVSNLKAKHLCKTQFVVVILNDDVSHIWRAIIKWLFEKKNKVILWAASNSAQSTPKIHFAKGGTIKATTLHSKKEISQVEFSDCCQSYSCSCRYAVLNPVFE